MPFCSGSQSSGNPCNVNYTRMYNEWVSAIFQWFTWAGFPIMTSSPLKTTKCDKNIKNETGNPTQVNFSRTNEASYYDLQSENNSIS